jgi:hypothetical protein
VATSRWLVLIGVTTLAGAQLSCAASGARTSSTRASGADVVLRAERVLAEAELKDWDKATAVADGVRFIPVGNGTGRIGTWESTVASNAKKALAANYLITSAHLSDGTPKPAKVRWDNGTTRTVQLISAAAAMAQFTTLQVLNNGDCGSCSALEVTGARLGHATVDTTRGSADAPVWEFKIRGSSVRVTRLAVAIPDGVAVAPLAPSDARQDWISVEAARVSDDGQTLTVGFAGRSGGVAKTCGADYTAEAAESQSAVAVIVIEHPSAQGAACPDKGAGRTTTVKLRNPLGERAVVDVAQGDAVLLSSG